MVGPALRALAVAGVLIVAGVSGGVAAVPALAQPTDTDGSGQTSDDPAGGGSEDAGGGGDTTDDPVDSGDPSEEPDEPEPSRESAPDQGGSGDYGGTDDPATESPAPTLRESPFENSITLPFIRLPSAGEIPMGSWPTVSTFYTTVEIPVPTLGEFLEALQIVPSPAPPPGPAIRTQEEAPVADATTGATGGGGGGSVAEPVIFRAPLVTVPRAGTVAGKPPRTLPGKPGAAAPNGVTAPGVAGVATPVIRGSVPSTPGVTALPPASPTGGQFVRLGGNPRGVTNPTLAEIAAVALPGLAGLIFLTFSGGVIGYRQANSTRFVRTAGAERFLP